MAPTAAHTIAGLPVLLAASGGSLSSSQIALIVVIVGVSLIMLISTRRRIMVRNSNSPRAYVREQIAQIKEERQVSQEVCTVLQELEKLARQVNAQMDSRSAKLESLIRAADERINRLTRLTEAASEPVAAKASSVSASAALSPRQATLRRLVGELSDAGYNTLEIATRVGLPAGEVELILALRVQTAASA
jgi:hypothetical protein